MKRIFVSVPMAGRADREIYADMEKAMSEYIAKNQGEEIRFVNNMELSTKKLIEADKSKIRPLIYLGEAIRKMANCDDVIFAGDWENARGCKIERFVYDLYYEKEES